MVKRAPTPPPAADDPKLLVVTHPYPGPNLGRRHDLLRFVFWIAYCMEGEYGFLYCVFHKPTAPDMILVEICNGFDGYRRLLGAHNWSEFLITPIEDAVSCIYFSALANGRAAEKAGWKRIFVEDAWFEQFSMQCSYIMYPYPDTSYCLPPKEDQTAANVCRHLPLDIFNLWTPPPPSAPVGSSQWGVQREEVGATPRRFSFAAVSRALGRSARPPVVSSAGPSSSSLEPYRSPVRALDYSSDIDPPPGPASIHPPGLASIHPPGLASIHPPGLSQMSETEAIAMADGTPFVDDEYIEYIDKFDAGSLLEDFGKLAIVAPSAKEPERPVCTTHGIVCKKAVCRDYYTQLRNIEREKNGGGRGGNRGNKRGASSRGSSSNLRGGRKRGGG